MSDKAASGNERLQLDTEGQLVGKLIKMDGQLRFLLAEGFMFIKHPTTGRILVWDRNNQKTVEFVK